MRLKHLSYALLLVLLCSTTAFAQPKLVVGYTGDEWYTGVELEYSKRQPIGFFGYQENNVSGLLALTNLDAKVIGYAQVTQKAFVGNLRYSIGMHAGNPQIYANYSGGNKIGLFGEVMKLAGKKAYGVEAELNLVGVPTVTVAPFLESRGEGTLRWIVGIGTHPAYLRLTYALKPSDQMQIELFGTYYVNQKLDYGMSLNLAQNVTLSGSLNTNNELRLGLSWDGTDHPFNVGIIWHDETVQWHVGYRFKI